MKKFIYLTILCLFHTVYGTEKIQTFEAENVISNLKPAKNRLSSSRWDVWDKDKDAKKNWSRGAVLRGGTVKKDSRPYNSELPVLTFNIPVKTSGIYDLYLTLGGRPLAVSVDNGKSWQKMSGKKRLLESSLFHAGESITVKVSACYEEKGNRGAVYVDYFTLDRQLELIDGKYFTSRMEAETLLTDVKPAKNRLSPTAWDVWDKDKNAEKNWSRGAVLRGGAVQADTAPEKSVLPVLDFAIPIPADGIYTVYVQLGGRPLAISSDGGKTWVKASGKAKVFRNVPRKKGEKLTLKISACYEEKGNRGPVYVDYFTLTNIPEETGFRNLDYSGESANKFPAGWIIKYQDPNPQDRLQVIRQHEKKMLHLFSAGPDYWHLRNEGMIDDCRPGERYLLQFDVRNQAENPYKVISTFHGMRGKTYLRPYIGMVENIIPSGSVRTINVIATVPENVPELRLEIHGFGNNVDFLFSPMTVTKLPGVMESIANTDWLKEVNGEKKKITSILPVMPGTAIRLHTALPENIQTTGKIKIQALASGVLYYSQLKTIELAGLPGKKTFLDFLIPYDADGIRLVLDDAPENFTELRAEVIPLNLPVTKAKKLTDGFASEPVREKLGRGLNAMPTADGKVYLSWRINPGEEEDGFDVFSVKDGTETRLNSSPVLQTSDFTVTIPVPRAAYMVKNCRTGEVSPLATPPLMPDNTIQPYRAYRLLDPQAVPVKLAPADLDGDGEYDYIVHHSVFGVDPWYRAWRRSRTRSVIEAFHRDGRRLWSYTLPWNIEGGTWYMPWVAYDINGDGKAEVILKSTLESDGDLREGPESLNAGKVLSGPERILVLDGMTGELLCHAPWPDRDEFTISAWGYNHSSRNQMAIAYLDGKTPCLIALRGTYSLMLAEAWQMKDGELQRIWQYNSRQFGSKYHGQGAHSTRITDLDGDGRDEIALGAVVLDDDGSPMWTTGLGHPDFLYIADYVQSNPGVEVLTMYETSTPHGGGITCAESKSGKVLWKLNKPVKHMHYGYSGDIDARYRGWEVGGEDVINGGHTGSRLSYHLSPSGEILGENATAPFAYYKNFCPLFAYWDGDLFREEAGNRIFDFRGGQLGGFLDGSILRIFDTEGDWREEIATAVKGEFRIYSTLIPAADRRISLMNDMLYRMAVASNANGYYLDPTHRELLCNQVPGISLTMLSKQENTLEITVTSPLDTGVKGVITLKKNPGMTFTPESFPVDIAPGKEFTIHIQAVAQTDKPLTIEAVMNFNGGKILTGQVTTGKVPAPWELPLIQPAVDAEQFVSQSGGEVMIREDKSGVHGTCFSHWDHEKHRINWEIDIPEAGKYAVLLRYCTTADAGRTLYIDDEFQGTFTLKETGGLGNSLTHWTSAVLSDASGEKVIELSAGKHIISLENADGTSMNLDYIRLIRR